MIKGIFVGFTTAAFRRSVGNLLREAATMLVHRGGVWKASGYKGRRGLQLNLGCGGNGKKGWVNVDLTQGADLRLDLREALPFACGSCSTIYCEHVLEHFDYPVAADFFLRQCHRVLQPGGVLSVGVPDTEWPLLEYAGVRRDGYFERAKGGWHPQWCRTELEHLNYHFRQGGEHFFAYDFKTLEKALAAAGFVGIKRRVFDPDLDSCSREVGTLYVAARKAGP